MKRWVCALLAVCLLLTGMALAEDPVMEATYQRAVQLMEAGEYDMAAAIFEMLDGYGDSAAQILLCKNAKQQSYYDRAQELFEAGEYDAAKEVYLMLGEFRDSAIQAIRCDTQKKQAQYDAADALAAAGQYEKAREAFRLMGDFADSPARVEQMEQAILDGKYRAAAALQEAGRYEEAAAAFRALNGYSDADARIRACEEQLHIAQLDSQIEQALTIETFDPETVYGLLKEARQYGLDETVVNVWYERAYDLEAVQRYGYDVAVVDLEQDGAQLRIVSSGEGLSVLKKGENGLNNLAAVEAPAYAALRYERDLSLRPYLLGYRGGMLDIYLLEAVPALVASVEDADAAALEWTAIGFVLEERLTNVPLREQQHEYIIMNGSRISTLPSPVTVDMDHYPAVDSGYELMTLYQEALTYQNSDELAKLLADPYDQDAIARINEWLAGRTIDRAEIILWNEETDDFICVVNGGGGQMNVRVVRTPDGEFRLSGLM